MATTLTFDTHSFVKELTATGMSEAQAEAQVRVLSKALTEFEGLKLNELATKMDIAELRGELFKWGVAALMGQAALIAALVKLL